VANHRIDDVDSGGAAYPGLRVDLDGIDDFVAALRREIENNLQPNVMQLLKTYEKGVCFGRVPYSPNMHTTQQVYYECLSRISALLGGYLTAARVLAAAAEKVAREYRDTDARVAVSTQSVSTALSDQIEASQKTPALGAMPAPVWLSSQNGCS
jgi:hypothetical protein